jgi:hypothetical protein
MESYHHIRTNYLKYDNIKQKLEQELSICQYSKDIAKKLKISIPTFFKYKSFLQLEHNRQYITSDEKSFANKIGMTLSIPNEAIELSISQESISTLHDDSSKKINDNSSAPKDLSVAPVHNEVKTGVAVESTTSVPDPIPPVNDTPSQQPVIKNKRKR